MGHVASALDKFQSPATSMKEKIVFVFLASILVVITSGVALNWSALIVILKGEGVYQDLCIKGENNTTDVCSTAPKLMLPIGGICYSLPQNTLGSFVSAFSFLNFIL